MRWSKYLDIDNALGAIGLCRASKASGVGSFFFGLGVGVVVGGAAALLLTPYKGTEARERLVKSSRDIGRTVSQRVGQLASSAQAGMQQSQQVQRGTTGEVQGTRIGTS